MIVFTAMQDRQHEARQRDAWMLANMLQPWSRQRLRMEDFYSTPTKTAHLTKTQKTAEFLRRLEEQGKLAPESTDG